MNIYNIIVIVLLATNLGVVIMLVLGKRTPKKPLEPTEIAPPQLPDDQMAKLRKDTQSAFEFAVSDAAQKFHGDLNATSQNLNQLIVRLTTDVVERELEEYRKSLAAARASALESLSGMQKAVEAKQQSLEADVDSVLAARREHLLQKLDERLGQAVASYIVESLGQGADLGAQKTFLLASLERNKDMLKKDLIDGV